MRLHERRRFFAHIFGALFLAALFARTACAQDSGGFYLKDGDRVVFYGDSITDQRLYTTFVETYVLTRFPRLNVRFVHSGWGGDRVTGGGGGPVHVRLQRDVIAYKPTVMTTMLGMNDASYRAYDVAVFKTYAEGYQRILTTVKSALPGLRITLIQPSPYDDVTRPPLFEGGYNAVLVRYGQYVKELAEREGATVADLNTPVVTALDKAQARDPDNAKRIVPDRVHPGPGGHLLMAEALLKAWKAPAAVTDVEIDAKRRRATRAENAVVTDVAANGKLSWTETDSALPMPINMKDAVLALAVRSSDFIAALDAERLKVTGLDAGNYTLRVDGEEVGAFSKQQLEEGINLAESNTPMAKQAASVHELTLKHNTIHFARWREVQVPLQEFDLARKQAAMEALDSLEEELIERQRAAAQPKPRHYQLEPKQN